jgi:hypothetical protein
MTDVWCLCSRTNLLHKSYGFNGKAVNKAITNMIQDIIGFAHVQCPDSKSYLIVFDIFI